MFSLGARAHIRRCDCGRYLPLHLCLAHGAASRMVLVNWAWLGGCRWWAYISREERVNHHRQAAGQVQSLHHHHVALPLSPLVVPLYQGGVAHVHQLQDGMLHNSLIGQNALPNPPVVIQNEIPSGQRERTQQPVRKDKNICQCEYV